MGLVHGNHMGEKTLEERVAFLEEMLARQMAINSNLITAIGSMTMGQMPFLEMLKKAVQE